MTTLTVGSACSGIGAPEVAWRGLGWRFLWQAETDEAASAVLRHHFPGVPNLVDMTMIAARVRAGEIEAPDVLVGHARTLFRALRADGQRMQCFGTVKGGWPRHTSRIGYDTPLKEFRI